MEHQIERLIAEDIYIKVSFSVKQSGLIFIPNYQLDIRKEENHKKYKVYIRETAQFFIYNKEASELNRYMRGHELICQLTNDITSFYGDEENLIRALSNLLVNAIRFMPVLDKKIEVILSESGEQIHFEIWNNGERFSDSTLKKGDKLFYTEDYSRGNKHYGIGLAFVKGVAIKHGGNLQLNNPARGGASAIISIKKKI